MEQRMETKAEIRKRILAARKGLTKEEAVSKSGAIVQNVIKTPEYEEADNVLLYADYNYEVLTQGIFEDAVFLPLEAAIYINLACLYSRKQ